MSSEGVGAVVFLPVIVAVGAGILIGQGVMWCGRKMQENYASACKSYTNLANQSIAEQRAKIDENRQFVLAAMVEEFTAKASARNTTGITTTSQKSAIDTALTAALDRARSALNSIEQTERVKADYEQRTLHRQLQIEIAACENVVAAEQILAARGALSGSVDGVRSALNALRSERQKITDTQRLRTYQTQQVQLILGEVYRELEVLRALLKKHPGQLDQQRTVEKIEMPIQRAQSRLDSDPKTAVEDAQEAQREVRKLTQMVTVSLAAEWEKSHQQTLELRGRLKALSQIAREAVAAQVISASRGNELDQRIAVLSDLITRMERETTPEAQNMLKDLSTSVEHLKQEVFALVGTGQQQRIGSTIATTLNEFGFKANLKTGEPATVTKVGDSVRIRAKQQGNASSVGRDERLAVFYVDRNGHVSYDFSGYVGNACAEEAERIFAALRAKGVVIVDTADEKQIVSGNISSERLKAGQFTPHFDMNKRQVHLHTALLEVLKGKMGYTNVEQRMADGFIELDAHNGPLGYRYHVELTPQGEAKIKRDGVDVSNNPGDQLAAAGRAVAMSPPPKKSEKERVTNDTWGQEYSFDSEQGKVSQ